MSGAVWVYGIVPADAALRELEQRGDRLPEVWVVEAGELGAIAGPAPSDDEKGTRDQALAHARVLEAAVLDAPVVPFRFGVMVPGEQDVGENLLLAHHDELAELLSRIGDRLQLTLKADYDEDALLREIVEREPQIAELREQVRDAPEEQSRELRIQLGELVNAAIEQTRERDAAELLRALDGHVVATASDPLERELMVLNAPLLVAREHQGELEEAVEQLAREHEGRMRMRLLGPLPPYAFVSAGAG